MKIILFSILLFISVSMYAQERTGFLYKSPTDTIAWLSNLRQYEPKITPSLTSRFWRGDKTWQDFNTATLAATLTGFTLNNSAITGSDNILTAVGKAQQQINFRELIISTGTTSQFWRGDKTWQSLSKNDVGLNNVLNIAQEPIITPGTTSQYWRGDKSWQTLDKTVVGLPNVLNIAQEPVIASGTTSQYWRGDKTWQSLDKTAVGLPNVLNIAQEPVITSGTTSQYWRGDKTWQILDKTAVGLPNVLNVTQEPALGNPGTTGYVLSSTTTGTRSWVALPTGYMLKYAGQAHQDNMLSSGVYTGLDNPGGGGDDFTTFTAWSTDRAGGFQLQSFDDAGYVGAYSSLQRFYARSYDYQHPSWRTWKRLLTDDDLTSINTSISTSTGTFQGSLSNTQSGFTINDYTLRRQGNVVVLTIRFSNTSNASPTAEYYLCDLQVGYRPTSTTYGASTIEFATDYETGVIKANTNGSISVRCGKANKVYVANLTWILLTP